MQPIRTGYLWDDAARNRANRKQCNYWFRYMEEIAVTLGVDLEPTSGRTLTDPARLARFTALILPAGEYGEIPRRAVSTMTEWVASGGTLLGFATRGFDELFGIATKQTHPQPGDSFTPAALLRLLPSPVFAGVHSPVHPDQDLLVFSPLQEVETAEASPLATLTPLSGGILPGITRRTLGNGQAYYFAFDLPQTLWVIRQGRPVDADHDGDGYLRTSDAIVTKGHAGEVLYADELLFLLRNLLAETGQPFIHPLPPVKNAVPDALFFFGGDDEADPGAAVAASNFMAEAGLPYHVNLMPRRGRFAVAAEEFRTIRSHGHECSLHFNFMDGFDHPCGFTPTDVRRQVETYREAFGETPVCAVCHWVRWVGWTEPAEWMLAAGVKADNSRVHAGSPPLNPAHRLGFAFGSAFPFWFYPDWRRENKRLEFLCEPITAYELGYRATDDSPDVEVLHRAVDLAVHYHLTMNMFYHPGNLRRYRHCRGAVRELLRYCREKNLLAVYMGNDELYRWWRDRSRSRVSSVRRGNGLLSFHSDCAHEGGAVIRIPHADIPNPVAATVEGRRLPGRVVREFGVDWTDVIVPGGASDILLKPADQGP